MVAIGSSNVGVYSSSEVARLSGLTPSRVHRWLAGYSFQDRKGVTHRSAPIVQREAGATDAAASFSDLVEILFVRAFLKHGVTMPKLRKAAQEAKALFSSPYPFSVRRFDTDGRTIFAQLDRLSTGRAFTLDLARSQVAFDIIVRPYFKQLDYEDDIVARWWPLGRKGRVVVDPRRSFGQPIDAESGIPTRVLYRSVLAGQTQTEVANWFEVPRRAVHDAVKFEKTRSEKIH